MKNLVLTVSPDSSIELLKAFADIIILDADPIPTYIPFYETLYIRSHFSQSSTLPEVFREEIEDIIQKANQTNPNIRFIDGTSTIDEIVAIEDKWNQYEMYGSFMPKTELLTSNFDTFAFKRPVFKKRLSSQGAGVTWDIGKTTTPSDEWIVQESLDIIEELRIYVIKGEVYPLGAIRQSKTINQGTQVVGSRSLTEDEIDFSLKIGQQAPSLEIIGIDIARSSNGLLYLMEVNRSPGFGKFAQLTGVNLASSLYTS